MSDDNIDKFRRMPYAEIEIRMKAGCQIYHGTLLQTQRTRRQRMIKDKDKLKKNFRLPKTEGLKKVTLMPLLLLPTLLLLRLLLLLIILLLFLLLILLLLFLLLLLLLLLRLILLLLLLILLLLLLLSYSFLISLSHFLYYNIICLRF
jgi:hypothetical protein